jgi:hypothetical protein
VLGSISDLIAQIMKQQQMPGGGVGMSDPNPALIPGGTPPQQQFQPGPLSLLAQSMAAGSRQAPVGAAGTPGGQSVPGFNNVGGRMTIPTNPMGPGIMGGFNPQDPASFIAANPFRQFGGLLSQGRNSRAY